MSDTSGDISAMLVRCPECDETVLGQPVGSMHYYEPQEGPPERWTLLRCTRKGHPMLVLQQEWTGMSFDEDKPFRVYPAPGRSLSHAVPEPLRREHEQARRCLEARAYTAAVVMIGRTLEGACAESGVKERTLQKSLETMHQKELIDGRLLKWAHALRTLRNEGAHYTGNQVHRADAEDALAFAEALLDYLYVLTARFQEFEDRRSL